jgi:hypothetical protein
MTNPNYSTYLGTATQLQRWRDFLAHTVAYAIFNLAFITVWLSTGKGAFWPAFPLVGWGLGLSFQHHANSWRGPITDAEVHRRMRQHGTTTEATSAGIPRPDGISLQESDRTP